MKKKQSFRFDRIDSRILFGLVTCFSLALGLSALAQDAAENSGIQFGQSYHNDVSPALRDIPVLWPPPPMKERDVKEIIEANMNPQLPLLDHVDAPDPVIDHGLMRFLLPDVMPAPILSFDGMSNACGCAPPDTNGAVGLTQFVESDNVSFQVFDKITGASVMGPAPIVTIWSGFGGVCQSSGHGDPVVLYDHIANRWLISQFAGGGITDECIAISTTSDATGTYNRYGFHLGSNFFDYPHLAVWPDGYYQSNNVFNSAGTTFLGPQAFAFERAKMLDGLTATFVSPGITSGAGSFLPTDFDGSYYPPSGTGNPYVLFPSSGTYRIRMFHADFVTPGNTTFLQIGSSPASPFTQICPGNRACVPQLPPQASLDAIGDRLMFRLAYRKFSDGHDAIVGNYTVSAGGVAGIRWFELRDVLTAAPTTFQESTYQPDTTYRWMGSAAMDFAGNLAVGFSASDATINPQVRYAGRLATDPINTLAQGEAHLVDGTGSQSGSGNRWGDYSAMTVDPVDDCTFWYTQEYYSTNGGSWKTRIGNFKFAECVSVPHAAIITSSSSLTTESCAPSNNVIDPGETVTFSFCVQNAGTAATSNLVGTLQNTGGVVGASGPATYGAMAPGTTSCQSFTFMASGNCGGALTATIHFQDGSTDLGEVTYTFTMGVANTTVAATENFTGVTAPALPTGWTSTATGAEVPWVWDPLESTCRHASLSIL